MLGRLGVLGHLGVERLGVAACWTAGQEARSVEDSRQGVGRSDEREHQVQHAWAGDDRRALVWVRGAAVRLDSQVLSVAGASAERWAVDCWLRCQAA